MDETDRIVAAIFTAGLCRKKSMEPADYFKVYDQCLGIIRERDAAAKASRGPMEISDHAMAGRKKKSRR